MRPGRIGNAVRKGKTSWTQQTSNHVGTNFHVLISLCLDAHKILVENRKAKDVGDNTEVKHCGDMWTGLIWLGIETRDESCKHGNRPSYYIKIGTFLDYLCDCQLLKYHSIPWAYTLLHRLHSIDC